MQQHLGCGNITDDGDTDGYVFRVTKKADLLSHVLPLFERSRLHTQKEHRYRMFRDALLCDNVDISRYCKEQLSLIPEGFVSPHAEMPSKSWVIGFYEAEGLKTFSIQTVATGYSYFYTGCCQKEDRHVLVQIIDLIVSKGNGKVSDLVQDATHTKKMSKFKLGGKENLPTIMAFFANSMYGMKAVEFLLWNRAYLHTKDLPAPKACRRRDKQDYLLAVKTQMQDLRNTSKYLHIIGQSCKLRPGSRFGKWTPGCNVWIKEAPGISTITPRIPTEKDSRNN